MIAIIVGFAFTDLNTTDNANGTNVSEGSHHYQVKIITDGDWEGSLSSSDVSMNDISGSGNKTIDLGNSDSIDVNVDISKTTDSSTKLTVKLYGDGKVVDEDSTDMPGGTVLISA